MMNKPAKRVSIGVICYNQVRYIRQALESIFHQDFQDPFEVIVCDDHSSDGSFEIIREFQDRFPNEIQVHRSDQNSGPMAMAQLFCRHAKGEYLSWLDGDDRWSYSGKITEQVRFLDQNPAYSGCFHDASIHHEASEKVDTCEYAMRFHHHWKTYSQFNRYREDFFPWDALERKIIPTASLVFRRCEMSDLFRVFSKNSLSISWIIHLWLLKSGKFRYFNEVWSEYRDHAEGFSKKYSLIDFKINNINILEALLNDGYYRDLKKDVYGALVAEHRHLLSIPDIGQIGKSTFSNYLSHYQKYQKMFAKLEGAYFKDNFLSGCK